MQDTTLEATTKTAPIDARLTALAAPESAALPEWATTMTDVELVDEREQTRLYIAEFEEKLRPARTRIALIESVLLKRLTDRGATVLAHPDFAINVVQKDETDVLVSELLPLMDMAAKGEIDSKDLEKAVWWTTPQPELKKHLGQLKSLAKKYGQPVQAILDKAVRTVAGMPKLVIAPKERPQTDVTPVGEVA